MANTIQIKRGNLSNIPILASGELGFAVDVEQIYIGTGSSNVRILTIDDIYTNSNVDSHLSGGTGINYSSGTISIDSTVATQTWVSSNYNNYSLESHDNTYHSTNYEPELGNPDINGKVLSSTSAGVRSWVTMASGYSNTYSSATSWTVTHNLGSYNLIVQCWSSNGVDSALLFPNSITRNSTNQLTINWGSESVAGQVCIIKCT